MTNSGIWENVKRNVLPQGAPTSPVITNIICQRLDFILTGVAKRFGLKYSRYADDITFSSTHNVYQDEGDFKKELQRIVLEQGFHIKESKTRLQKDGYRKEVTGLLVNEKVNVQKRYIKQLRMWLYYWEQYGYKKAYSFFLQQYFFDKGKILTNTPDMANVIGGKLDYLKMVKGAENNLYLELQKRFDKLTIKKNLTSGKLIKNTLREDVISTLSMPLLEINKKVGLEELPVLKEITTQEEKTASLPLQNLIEKKGDTTNDSSTILTLLPNKEEKIKVIIPFVHSPKALVHLLKKFSINDSALKYTTHSWDVGRDAGIFKDFKDFLNKSKKEYSSFSFELKELNGHLNAKIFRFLFDKAIGKDGWGINRIKFGWSSPEILKECKNNPNLKPEDVIIPEQYQLQIAGKTIQKFKQVIDIFKNEIEIRDETSTLENLILNKHDKYLPSFAEPIITNLNNKTFYTDVQWFEKALDMIFENIQSRPQHRQVKYSLNDEEEDVYELEILHIGSFNIGKSINDEKLQLIKGNFGDMLNSLKNLCDWSIESKFREGCYRINYLKSDIGTAPFEMMETEATGFKHILTFYK